MNRKFSSAIVALPLLGLLAACDLIAGLVGGKDETPPEARITAPAAGADVSGNVLIQAQADDDVGVFKVVFFVDGLKLAEDRVAPYEAVWDAAAAANGIHYLKAEAWDDAGNVGESASIAVDKQGTGGAAAEDFADYPLGSTGTASGHMPADATWAGLALQGAALDIVADPAGSGRGNGLRLSHGAAAADEAYAYFPLSGFGRGEVAFDLYLAAEGAFCVSLGSGDLATATRTAALLWLADRGAGTTAAWSVDAGTVGFGTATVSTGAWHRLRLVFDCAADAWGAYLDGQALVYRQAMLGAAFGAIEYLLVSTSALATTPPAFGGAFIVDALAANSLATADLPEEPTVAAPASLSADPRADGVHLAWTDSSANETDFLILRGSDPAFPAGSYTILYSAAAGTTVWTDATAVPGPNYYYRVVARLAFGGGNYYGFSPVAGPVVALSPPDNGPAAGVYLAGGYTGPGDAKQRAVVWYDDGTGAERLVLTDGTREAAANDVCVAADAVYACGYVKASAATNAVKTGAVWRIAPDGTVTASGLENAGTAYNVVANAIKVEGGKVYVVGEDWNPGAGITAVLWVDGASVYLTDPDDYFAAANDLIVLPDSGAALVSGVRHQGTNLLQMNPYVWAASASGFLSQATLLPAGSPRSYSTGLAADGASLLGIDHLFVSGYYYDGTAGRAAVWGYGMAAGDGTAEYLVGPQYVDSRTTGIARGANGSLYVCGFVQAEGTIYDAVLWSGPAAALVRADLPKPHASTPAWASDVEVAVSVAYVAGEWKDASGARWGGYWTVGAGGAGRRIVTGAGDAFAVNAVAVKNPTPDFALATADTAEPPTVLPAYPAAFTATTGLVAYYPLAGSGADASGNGLDGNASGGPAACVDRFGASGGALGFDGVDDYLAVADNDLLDLGADWAISVWVKPSRLEANDYFRVLYKSRYDGAASPPTFGGGYNVGLMNSEGYLAASFYNNVYGQYSYYTRFPADPRNVWTHLLFTGLGTASHLDVYIDGVLSNGGGGFANVAFMSLAANAYPLYIGRANYASDLYGQEYFPGGIDDLRIFNRYLSAAEAAALYAEGGYTGP
jgi:hypothetical protein